MTRKCCVGLLRGYIFPSSHSDGPWYLTFQSPTKASAFSNNLIPEMTMHRSFLVASVLLLILSGHSEFLDMNPDFDPPLQLFPSNDFIDDQSEVSSNLDDLPYSYFFAGAGDCASASNGSPSRVRARNNACPVVDDEGIPKRPTTYREKVINQLMAPLDPLDETGETAEKNYVNGFCLDSTIDRRAIPVCTSGFESDVYLNAFGGVTLRNCELCELIS